LSKSELKYSSEVLLYRHTMFGMHLSENPSQYVVHPIAMHLDISSSSLSPTS
jgi:hypothetical protein